MAPLLPLLNEKLFQKLPGSRASTFAETDAPALLSLPLQRYAIAQFETVKVHIDYRVEVERHRYSVPHSLAGQVLEAPAREASPRPPRTCRPHVEPTWNGRRPG